MKKKQRTEKTIPLIGSGPHYLIEIIENAQTGKTEKFERRLLAKGDPVKKGRAKKKS